MENGTTLITGASSGIGLHLAHEFAKHGHPLVLVAPVESELQRIAEEFRSKNGVDVRVIAKDLREESAAQEIFDEVQSGAARLRSWLTTPGMGSAASSGKYRSRPTSRCSS